MFTQYFGNYLLKEGRVAPAALKAALERLDSVKVKLGVLAVDAGLMTPAQVEEVHALQKGADVRFGDLAVDKGYIDRDAVDALLARQGQGHLLLSQALVDAGVMNVESLEAALGAYKHACGLTDAEFEAFKRNDVDIASTASPFMPETVGLEAVRDYFGVLLRSLVRFVDATVILGQIERADSVEVQRLVLSTLEGGLDMAVGLAGNPAELREIASRFAQMPMSLGDPLVDDGLGEFMNTVNGLFISKKSNDGVEIELLPPIFHNKGRISATGGVLKLPVEASFGAFDFLLAFGALTIDQRGS